jgi:hypothetical protein
LNGYGEVRVTKHVLIFFFIGKYEDEELCDVIFMNATYFLLVYPRQFNRKAKHDGFKNKYSLEKNKKIFIFIPLSPLKGL